MTGFGGSVTTSANIFNVNVWPTWNQQWSNAGTQAGTGAVTTVLTSNVVWQAWNSIQFSTGSATTSVTSSNLIVNAQTWGGWNAIFAQGTTIAGTGAAWPAPRKRTAEEKAADKAAAARVREREAQALALQRAAKMKARALLFSFLTDDQKREATDFKRFHLTTRSGRRFRIHMGQGRHGNIKELEGDREVRSYCIAPGDPTLPEEDALLAQKFALEHDEAEFLRIANMTRVA